MGRVKAMLMDQEEKLDEYVWYIVSECETFEEFRQKVWDYIKNNDVVYKHSEFGLLSDVWNEYWSEYNMEGK
jgi:hypothetical protein|tara:strand:- start:300 stop:515 length:216 start_codon:yes stop_codon:yes gene_type:complete